jgi:hypothetical protein
VRTLYGKPKIAYYVSDSDEIDDISGQEVEDVGDTTKFVVERLVSHDYRNGGDLYSKVR